MWQELYLCRIMGLLRWEIRAWKTGWESRHNLLSRKFCNTCGRASPKTLHLKQIRGCYFYFFLQDWSIFVIRMRYIWCQPAVQKTEIKPGTTLFHWPTAWFASCVSFLIFNLPQLVFFLSIFNKCKLSFVNPFAFVLTNSCSGQKEPRKHPQKQTLALQNLVTMLVGKDIRRAGSFLWRLVAHGHSKGGEAM